MPKAKHNGHGGARAGSGPKKPETTYDEAFKKDFKAALNKLKKENGNVSFLEAALKLMWEDKTQDTVKASLLKIYAEVFTVKKAESDINVSGPAGPGILLPPLNDDPADKVEK